MGTETIIFKPEEMIGIVDLRSLGYYKICIQQQNLSKYYTFERADTLCEYFNKFINTLKKEREQKEPKESYPWLDPSDERKYMMDHELLDNLYRFRKFLFNKGRKERCNGNSVQV